MRNPWNLVNKRSVFLLVYLSVNVAVAQVYNSSISSATAGTGRATVEAGDAAFLNPASLVHLRGRYLWSSFADDELAISLSDNTPETAIPAALSYVKQSSKMTLGDLDQHNFSMSLSEFVIDKISFGVTGHYLEQKLPNSSYRQINGDLGLMYTPRPHIGLALVAYNIFGEKNDIPKELRKKFHLGAGFNYIYKNVARFRLDATSDSIFMTGIETYATEFLITRFGYQNDIIDKRELLTAGLGFKGPRFGLHYAYQGSQQSSADYRHSVDLEIPF